MICIFASGRALVVEKERAVKRGRCVRRDCMSAVFDSVELLMCEMRDEGVMGDRF